MKASVTFALFLLLGTGTANQNVTYENVKYESSGKTPLIKAAYDDNVNLVKKLLNSGVDAKATDSNGQSALMYAAIRGNDKAVELLLPKSDTKATDNLGSSALMLAAVYGNIKVVELLLPFSDVKVTNRRGNTALDLAKSAGRNQIVRLLQQYSNPSN